MSNISDKNKRRAFLKISENIIPNLSDEEIDSLIKEIDIPVKIIYGDHDNVIPNKNIEKLNNSLLDSKLVIIKECGHVPQEEHPESVAKEIISFLGE